MRNTFFTIPTSFLVGGISDMLIPINNEVRGRIYRELIRAQEIVVNNCGNVKTLQAASIIIRNINYSLTEFKERLVSIQSSLNIDKEYEFDSYDINQKNEFLLSTTNNNFEIKILTDSLLEDVSKLEEKSLALDNELAACLNNESTVIPSEPPKDHETVLIQDNIYKISLVDLFSAIRDSNVERISTILFSEYNILLDFLNKNLTSQQSFSRRFFLTLEECSVAAYIRGLGLGIASENLLNKLSINSSTIQKYSEKINTAIFNKTRTSSLFNSTTSLSTEQYKDTSGNIFKLEVIKIDRYRLAPVYKGIALDSNNNIVKETSETFSNSPLVILNELKYKLKHNIS